jgi:uncharacterized membrane protein YraQ (UPF0718 family)
MKEKTKGLWRYRFALVFILADVLLLIFWPKTGLSALTITKNYALEMFAIVPPVFLLLGLLDTWVDRQTVMRYMGEHSGAAGGLIAFLMGSAAAGPLYAAFPVAAVLLKKGVRLLNVFIFLGAWSTAKVPMLLFEASNLGLRFMLLRLACNIVGIVIIAAVMERTTSESEKLALYENAEKL